MNAAGWRHVYSAAMKLAQTLLMTAALVGGGFSFAAADDKKPDAKEVPADYTAKYLAFFDKVIDTVIADKDDCNKMGDELTAQFAANDALLQQANQFKKDGKKFGKDAQDHMLAGIKKSGPAINKCMANDKVKTAFKTFAGKADDKRKGG